MCFNLFFFLSFCSGLITPSGLTSIPAGMETPDMIELRKRKNIEEAMEVGAEQQPLYTVLPEKRISVGAAMMGSAHVYDITSVNISVTIAVSLLVTLKCKYSVDFRFIERLTVDHCHYFLLSEQKIYCFFFLLYRQLQVLKEK